MGQLVLTLAEEDKKQSEGGGKRTRRRGETCLCLLLLLDCLSSLSRTEKLQMLALREPGRIQSLRFYETDLYIPGLLPSIFDF